MKKLSWGLIGCGDISQKRVAPAIRDLKKCDFIAVNRANYDLADAFAKEFGAKKAYRTWMELIRDDEIEAVYIATPVYLHAEQTIMAAEAGKHVLCEKPMALNVPECDKMIDACKANNVKLGIAYYRHFYPLIDRIKEILYAGEIGDIVIAQINAFEWFDRTPGEPRSWLLDKKMAGGGPMMDFGCHRIEVFMNILGSISKTYGHTSLNFFQRNVEDTAFAHFEIESGTQAILSVTQAAMESMDTLDIFGTKGSLHIPVLNEGTMIVKTTTGQREEKLPPHSNFHQPLIENFTTAVLNGKEPIVNGQIGKEVNEILQQIYVE